MLGNDIDVMSSSNVILHHVFCLWPNWVFLMFCDLVDTWPYSHKAHAAKCPNGELWETEMGQFIWDNCKNVKPCIVFVKAVFVEPSVFQECLRPQKDSWLDGSVIGTKHILNEAPGSAVDIFYIVQSQRLFIQSVIQRSQMSSWWLEMWQCPPVFQIGK